MIERTLKLPGFIFDAEIAKRLMEEHGYFLKMQECMNIIKGEQVNYFFFESKYPNVFNEVSWKENP